MNESYRDITDRLGEPLWWDEAGCPRYCEFTPRRSNYVYADEVVLMEIECQGCGEQFKVALSQSWFRASMHEQPTLTDMVEQGTVHYGDPPNYSCCAAGPTMNSIPLRVLEFWRKERELLEWQRIDTLERVIECEWA